MNFPKIILFSASLFLPCSSALADSLLVGTNLSTSQPGPELCPVTNGCQLRAQQFTLSMPVLVSDLKVAMSGPVFEPSSTPLDFSLGLGTSLGSISWQIGSGVVTPDPTQSTTTEIFDFDTLGLFLAPGTYYLQASGGNVMWNSATPLTTAAGSVGVGYDCADSNVRSCNGSFRWDPDPLDYAFQLDGTALAPTPELPTSLLSSTGIFSIAAMALMRMRKEQNRIGTN